MIWTCKDGRKIPVAKLEEEHLVNIVEMWRRSVDRYRQRYFATAQQMEGDEHLLRLQSNNDIEDDYLGGVEGMLVELETDDFLRLAFPIFNDLLWECISRGLMHGDTGEWLREPGLDRVDTVAQLEMARRLSEMQRLYDAVAPVVVAGARRR